MSGPIDFYFDFSSPYGYLGAEIIGDIGLRHNRQVIWRPYLMGVVFKKYGTQPLVNDPLKGDYARRDIVHTAAYLGIPFSIPDPFPVNSISACRAYYWMLDIDVQRAKRFALRMMRGYFQDNIDLSNLSNVIESAVAEGFDENKLNEEISQEYLKNKVREEVNSAMNRGLFGSPVFIVDDEMFWGTDRIEQLEKWLVDGSW